MHEFAIKGVALEEFKAVRGLCRSLNVLLAADDSHIARIILRTLKYMMLDDVAATSLLIGLRLAKCLAAKDDDVKYWALSLVHEFVLHPQYRPQLIESGAFAQVINVGLTAASSRTPLKATEEIASASAYMWDILVMMWSSKEDLNQLLKSRGLAEATCVLLQMEQLSGNLEGSRLAVAMAEMAKTSETLDRRLTRYGVNLNRPDVAAVAGIFQQ
ncbi:hypothetical protein CPB97_000765 [Podila verticillata]|nr:hypothetical protein CPB97_000765 [Podila verticillata]